MTNQQDMKEIMKRLVSVRAHLLSQYPFFGRLLLNLKLGFAKCETAYTDMVNIVFDPSFASELSDEGLSYVYLHELLHCVLKHCTRCVSFDRLLYNIACDIVVNSMINEMFSIDEFKIDGQPLMHLAPNGKEGRLYSAEEVYKMLLKKPYEQVLNTYLNFDVHSEWGSGDCAKNEKMWDNYIRKAASYSENGSGIPAGIRRYVKEIKHHPSTNWRHILHDFIQKDKYDYVYTRPDRRFDGDLILPSFCENEDGSFVRDLWFFIDTSASVTDSAVSLAYYEIKDAIEQIGSMSGTVLFFDTVISKPFPFESTEDLMKIKPVGGGGTNFDIVFNYVKKQTHEQKPVMIVIITDGYAPIPENDPLSDIPTMWIIVNSDVNPTFGSCVHIDEKEI